MPKNESVDFFLRFLNERFDVFKRSFENLKEILVQNNADNKIAACKETLQTIVSLKEAMSSSDHPKWIGHIEGATRKFIERHRHYADAGKTFINAIIACSPYIQNQKWEFSESQEYAPVDFDGYFQKFYDESRLPELFDELVSHLQVLIESGQIDSIHVFTQLQKLTNTIRHNARGSYFSVHATFDFAITFLKNLALEYLEKIPVLAETLRAIQKTIDELKSEFATVQQKTRDDVIDKLKTDLPLLGYTPEGARLIENTPSIDFNA